MLCISFAYQDMFRDAEIKRQIHSLMILIEKAKESLKCRYGSSISSRAASDHLPYAIA